MRFTEGSVVFEAMLVEMNDKAASNAELGLS
jgi:hypothetical protein